MITQVLVEFDKEADAAVFLRDEIAEQYGARASVHTCYCTDLNDHLGHPIEDNE